MFRIALRPAAAFLAAFVLPLLGALPAQAGPANPDPVHDCHIGAYRLKDGRLVDLGPSTGTLRWRQWNGTTGALHPGPDGVWTSTLGWTDKPDGHRIVLPPCPGGEIVFDGVPGRRIAFDSRDTTFTAKDGVKLAGRLVLPKDGGRVPIVVLIHGSESYSGRDYYPLQRLLPAKGVGVFVYDKRGTGASQGRYTQDFPLLADDAAAALREAERMAGPRVGRVGFEGGSQGGWIAPLAAERIHADFVIVGFGLAVSPAEEDREEVILDMQLKGDRPEDIRKALELHDAATVLVESRFTKGFERFAALQAKYRQEPWYKDVGGDYTPLMLPLSTEQLKAKKKMFVMGTPWSYDPMPVLRRLNTPQLWILGADDVDAPSAETSRRIGSLIAQGRPITLAIYPGAEHGIYEYLVDANGERKSTRNSEGFFRMIRDYARDGRLSGSYGRSSITRPK